MKIKHIFPFILFLITLFEIVGDLSGHYLVVYITKPLILVSIIGFVLLTPDSRKVDARKLFVVGLFFALLGDIFLMIRENDLFIPGLGSFLIMQMIYTYAFHFEANYKIMSKSALLRKLPFLCFALIFYLILQPHLPDAMMKLAVAIYAFSIATMAWMAFLRKDKVSDLSFLMVFSGALLFMISDSLIAVNKFLTQVPLNTLWVMASYAAAQYLIVIGFLKTK